MRSLLRCSFRILVIVALVVLPQLAPSSAGASQSPYSSALSDLAVGSVAKTMSAHCDNKTCSAAGTSCVAADGFNCKKQPGATHCINGPFPC